MPADMKKVIESLKRDYPELEEDPRMDELLGMSYDEDEEMPDDESMPEFPEDEDMGPMNFDLDEGEEDEEDEEEDLEL